MYNPEDEKFLEEAKKDSKKYQKLYDKYFQKVYNYFWYRNGHNNELAEDLMQEVFIKAFKKLTDFDLKECSYFTYLLTISHNLLVNHYRDSKKRGEIALDSVPEQIIKNVDNSVDIELMWKMIYKMPIIERDVLLLRFRKELSIKEISKIISKSENAVKLIIYRAKKKLINIEEPKILNKLPSESTKYIKPKFIIQNSNTF